MVDYPGVPHKQGITALWTQVAVLAAGIKRINRHKCLKCKTQTYYELVDVDLVYHDCKCSTQVPRSISWYVVAALITSQTTAKTRLDMALRFGIDYQLPRWRNIAASRLAVPYAKVRQLNELNQCLSVSDLMELQND